jgi:hypothetical protein
LLSYVHITLQGFVIVRKEGPEGSEKKPSEKRLDEFN